VRAAGAENGAVSQPGWVDGVARERDSDDSAPALGVHALEDAGVFCPVGAGMEITPLHTEQRARTPLGGTLDGSTRKIDRQSGQLTFIPLLQSCDLVLRA
jgi:hypothetical protein